MTSIKQYVFYYLCSKYKYYMLTKNSVLKTINKLPDNIDLDELIDKLIFIDKVEKGLDQSLQKQVVSETLAKKKLAKWLK